MPDLTARFCIADNMSDRLQKISQTGMSMADQFEKAGRAASSAFDEMSAEAASVVSGVRGVSTSVTSFNDAARKCSASAGALSNSIDEAAETQESLITVMQKASKTTEELSDNENVSAKAKDELTKASEEAEEAVNELTAAQQKAEAAMQAYDEVMASGTRDLETLEAAAESAGQAAESLAEANGKASTAMEDLSEKTEQASKEAENGKNEGLSAIKGVASALAAAGITVKVKEIAEAVYELASTFSEAESTVVRATGATGDALDELTDSMMAAYSASKTGDLESTAAVIGDINTRLGYTGDILTDTTGLFLDFAAATGGNAASSVRSVTQLMHQWFVPATGMKNILDKLTYAGQASGISVDTLTQQLTNNKAILDQLGFSLDEAIAMFMNFELAGTNSTAVMMGFRTALSSGAISSLEELYDVFDQISSGAMTAVDASEMFGSRAGPAIVNAVTSGVLSLDEMVGSLEAADGTLAITAEAAQTLGQKWTQASNNISTAFTSAVQPALNRMSSGFADIANRIGTFLHEYPAVAKGITVIGVGLGTVAVAIAGVSAALGAYKIVTTIATAITATFGATFVAAFLPITGIVAAVTALATAVYFLVDAFQEDLDETEGMTAATREQYYELQNLNDEYSEACEKYGETSEEASRLKYQVDDLSATFEASRQTLEEFQAEGDRLCDTTHEITVEFQQGIETIKADEIGVFALIQKYEDLASKAKLTGAEEQELETITKELAKSFPDIATRIDGAALSAEEYVAQLKYIAQQEADERRQEQAQESYVKALQKKAELTEKIAKAQENLNLEQERMDNMSSWKHFWARGEWNELKAYQAELDKRKAANAKNEANLIDIEKQWEDLVTAEEDTTNVTLSWEKAAATAFSNVQQNIEELCQAYDDAYQSALESLEGQYGLFDEASTQSKEYMTATVANAQAAMDSQLAYWESYEANLNILKNTSKDDLGITEENYQTLMAYVQNGSEKAAGLAASMAKAINSGNSTAIATLAETIGKVIEQRNIVAKTTADWQTDFTKKMRDFESEMTGIIADMNMKDDAKEAATATVESYADSILAGKTGAVKAAKEVANAVTAALARANANISVGVSSSGIPGHAKGTTNAESAFVAGEVGPELIMPPVPAYAIGTTNSAGAFIAGDNGPELVIGAAGSTVFPTSETDRLIAAVTQTRQPLVIQQYAKTDGATISNQEGNRQEKHILLELAGSGAIKVNGEIDKETILSILSEHIKPVLMGIIQNEIYEEGELTYDY